MKYYYVYAYEYDNTGFYGENNYKSTEFGSGVTEFKEIQTEEDADEFTLHVHDLLSAKSQDFKALMSWQEIK